MEPRILVLEACPDVVEKKLGRLFFDVLVAITKFSSSFLYIIEILP